ncbi:MAG: DUF4442 domain-containing protein [Ferruginibacter sp.]
MGSSSVKFLEIVQHPIKFRLFLLSKLPSAFFSGVRIKYVDETNAIVTIPYKWFSKNPFRSTYFACLSMAAEMSTAVLAMAYTYEQKPAMSMLVIKTEAIYLKKATGVTSFSCEDGPMLKQTIEEAMASGKGTSFAARSIGRDKAGDTIAEFTITWSFKAKTA